MGQQQTRVAFPCLTQNCLGSFSPTKLVLCKYIFGPTVFFCNIPGRWIKIELYAKYKHKNCSFSLITYGLNMGKMDSWGEKPNIVIVSVLVSTRICRKPRRFASSSPINWPTAKKTSKVLRWKKSFFNSSTKKVFLFLFIHHKWNIIWKFANGYWRN